MKKCFKSAVLAAAVFCVCVFVCCKDVGLGSSIDAAAPALEITFPPSNAIIRNTFTLKGSASDDVGVSDITVVVKNTTTGKEYYSAGSDSQIHAVIDRSSGEWSAVVNRWKKDSTDTEYVYDLPDGKYQVTVTAYDNAKRSTVARESYEIDNTPPVVVIKRPAGGGMDVVSSVDSYGRIFKITGDISDDHLLDKMVVRVYEKTGNEFKQCCDDIEYSNISGVGLEQVIAQYNPFAAEGSEERAQHDLYMKIYGTADSASFKTKIFYCTIDVSDEARMYEVPEEFHIPGGEDETRGNISTRYYVYDDIYKEIFSASGKFKLTMKDLSSIYNGSYESKDIITAVKGVLVQHKIDSARVTEKSSVFTLNPDNSPAYEVSGYKAENKISSLSLTNNSKITIKVSPGRDGISLNSDSIEMYLVSCDEDGELYAESDAKYAKIILLPSVARIDQDNSLTDSQKIAKKAARNALLENGENISCTLNVGTLKPRLCYRVLAAGVDLEENAVSDGDAKYGFLVVSNGKPPVITFDAENASGMKNPADLAVLNNTGFSFSGVITSDNTEKDPEIEAQITRKNEKDSSDTETKSLNVEWEKQADGSYIWKIAVDERAGFPANPDSLNQYTCSLKVTDDNGITESARRIFVDTKKPEVKITALTPVVKKNGGETETTEYVNGVIRIQGSVEDNYLLKDVSYTLKSGDSSIPEKTESLGDSFTFDVFCDTREFTDNNSLQITFTAVDSAGNTAAISRSVRIDQSTDKPIIKIGELSTVEVLINNDLEKKPFISADGKISITAEDDDGLADLAVTVKNKNGNSVPSLPPLSGFTSGSTYASVLQAVAGIPEGLYTFTVAAADNAFGEKCEYSFDIYVVEDYPTIDFDTGLNQYLSNFELSVTASDSSGIQKVEQPPSIGNGISIVANGQSQTDKDSGKYSFSISLDENFRLPVDNNFIKKDGDRIKVTIPFTATDNTGLRTKKDFTYFIDSEKPSVEIKLPSESSGYVRLPDEYTFRLEGASADKGGSGVRDVRYAVVPKENSAPEENSEKWLNAQGVGSWVVNADMTGSASGEYVIYVMVRDAAGNTVVSDPKTIYVDEKDPILLIESGAFDKDIYSDNIAGTVLSGTAADAEEKYANAGVEVAAEYSYKAGAAAESSKFAIEVKYDAAGNAQNKNWSFNLPDVPGAFKDGEYVLTVTAKDAAARKVSVSYKFKVDTTAPDLTITSPADNAEVRETYIRLRNGQTSSCRIEGTASDVGSALDIVQYAIVSEADSEPAADSSEWKGIAVSNGKWAASADFSGKLSGAYSIYVKAQDIAGNAVQKKVPQTYYADTANPSIDGGELNRKSFNADFEISGTAADSDTYSSANVNLKVSLTGKDASGAALQNLPAPVLVITDKNGQAVSDAAEKNWTIALPVSSTDAGSTKTLPEGNYVLTLTAEDASGASAEKKYEFTIDKTAPNVTFSNVKTKTNGVQNPADPVTAFTDLNPKIYGSVADALSELHSVSAQFYKAAAAGNNSDGIAVGESIKITNPAVFALEMASVLTAENGGDGFYYALITASDSSGSANSAALNTGAVQTETFLVDRKDPSVKITDISSDDLPVGGENAVVRYVSASKTYTVSGTASDDNGIKTVTVSVLFDDGIEKMSVPVDVLDGGVWSAKIIGEDVFNKTGSYNIIARAEDAAGRIKEDKLTVISDSTPPEISFVTPYSSEADRGETTLIGDVTISGSSKDDSSMKESCYAVGGNFSEDTGTVTGFDGAPISWIKFDSAYEWNVKINLTEKANTTYAKKVSGKETEWDVPFHLKAVDSAGNISYKTLQIRIDTNIDKPTVEIISPADKAIVGGAFMVTGSAADNTFVHSVYMQVEIEGAVYKADGTLNGFNGCGTLFADEETEASPAFANKNKWYKINGENAWNYTLNNGNAFDKENLIKSGVPFTEEENGRENSNTTTKLKIRIRARDKKTASGIGDVYGHPAEISVTLQSGAPTINVQKLPASNSFISGIRNFEFSVEDDEAVESLRIIAGNRNIYIEAADIDSSGAAEKDGFTVTAENKNTAVDDGIYFRKWNISGTIDTADTSIVSGTSLTVTIEATDYSVSGKKTTSDTRTLFIDNNPPEMKVVEESLAKYIKGAVNRSDAAESIAVLGTAAEVSGNAADTGSGMKMVVLYMTKEEAGSHYVYPMLGGEKSAAASIKISGTDGKLDERVFPDGLKEKIEDWKNGSGSIEKADANLPYVMLDKAEGFDDAGDNGDQDGYNEQFSAAGAWSVKLDSTKMKSGFYTVHAVAIDNAYNMTYVSDDVLIQNNRPYITGMTLYTDLDGDGDCETEKNDNRGLAVNFNAVVDPLTGYAKYTVEDFDFTVKNNLLQVVLASRSGNGSKTYTLTPPAGTAEKQGTDGTTSGIFTFSSFPEEDPMEKQQFEISVKDTVPLESEKLEFSLTYDNVDDVEPIAYFYELNTKSAENVAAPEPTETSETSNSVLPSLLLDKNGDLTGHIDPRSSSKNDSSLPQDSDVSGTIVLRGKVFDDQRIDSITLKLSDNGVLSTEKTILKWEKTERKMKAPKDVDAFVIDESLDLGGHTVEWAYTWNTQEWKIGALAQNNVTVEVAAVQAKGSLANKSVSIGSTEDYPESGKHLYNNMTVDIVPYITKISRPQNRLTVRSRYGRYPVVRGETLTVNGFNFADDMIVTVGSQTVTPAVLKAGGAFEFMVPEKSGALNVTVNGVDSQNNTNVNTTDAPWNREKIVGDSDWTYPNSRYLNVWDIGHKVPGSSSVSLMPSFDFDDTGNIYVSWAQTGKSTVELVRSMNDESSNRVFVCYDQPAAYSAIGVEKSNGNLGITFFPDQVGSGGQFSLWGLGSANIVGGAAYVAVDKNSSLSVNGRNPVIKNGKEDLNPNILLDSNVDSPYYPVATHEMTRNPGSFSSPQSARFGGNGHVLFYDETTGALKYVHVPVTTSGQSDNYNAGRMFDVIVIDGPAAPYDREHKTVMGNPPQNYKGFSVGSNKSIDAEDTNKSGTAGYYQHDYPGLKPTVVGEGRTTVNVSFKDNTAAQHWADKVNANGNGGALAFFTDAYDAVPVRDIESCENENGTLVFTLKEALPAGTYTSCTLYAGHKTSVQKGTAPASSAGEYSSIDITSDGYPVIMYKAMNTIRVAYAATEAPAYTDWTLQETGLSGGLYISMKLDAAGNLHAVYKDGSALKYVYAPKNSGGGFDFANSACIQETIDTTGSLTMSTLSLIKEGTNIVPCVAYLNSEASEDGIKYAVRRKIAAAGDKEADVWDYQIVPAVFDGEMGYFVSPKNNRIYVGGNLGNWNAEQAGVPMAGCEAFIGFKTASRVDVVFLKTEN